MKEVKRIEPGNMYTDISVTECTAIVYAQETSAGTEYSLVVSVRYDVRAELFAILLDKTKGSPMFQGTLNELGTCSFHIPNPQWADGVRVHIKKRQR